MALRDQAQPEQQRAGELGHIEVLQVLCEDEISRRQAMSITRRLHRARFEEQATLEGFDFTASPKLPAAQIRDLAALRWLHAGESVILYGPSVLAKGTSRRRWATWPSATARTPQDWYALFPNAVVAESLLDRVINNNHQVFMNGPSYRPRRRPGQRNATTTKEPIQ